MYRRAPKADHSNAEVLDSSINRYRWFLLIFNVLALVIALATFGICIWIRFDLDFWEWVEEIDWYSYWYATYCVMLSMVGVITVSGLGVWGTIDENQGFLACFLTSLIIMFFWHLISAVVILVWGIEESPVLVGELHETFLRLVHKWDIDPRASRILKQIQEYVGCCGADGSQDFIDAHKPVPVECRDLVTGSEYAYGCQQQMAWWLEPWSGFLAGVSIFFMVWDVVGVWTAKKLKAALTEYNYNYG